MKINWGTGLTIGMLLFIGFILYFVVQIMTDKNLDFDMVTEDYFQKELGFQQELDAQQNNNTLMKNITSKITEQGLVLNFPSDLNSEEISGTIFMYRPSNKKLDFEIPIQLKGSSMMIPGEKLVPGRWNTIINWNYQGKYYLFKEKISF